MSNSVQFPNLQSRLLLKPWFDRQFIVPEAPPRLLTAFLRWYERRILGVTTDAITVSRPIFVMSLPRAGSSMLQNILCTHPDVAYINHSMHMFRATLCAAEDLRKSFALNAKGQRYLGDSIEVEAASACDPIMFWSEWLDLPLNDTSYRNLRLTDYSQAQVDSIKTAMRRILWCYDQGKHKRFLTKNPGLLPYMPLLAEMFPDAKFIHLVRDPRASANSMLKLYQRDKEQFEKLQRDAPAKVNIDAPFIPYPRLPRLAEYLDRFGPEDIRTTAHLWSDAIDLVTGQRSLLPSFHEIRYEDLLADPRAKVAEIFEFCELSQPKPENSAFHELMKNVGVIHHSNRYGSFELIEEICANNMHRYGYF